MFQKITQRYIALLFGAFCVSMGYVISVPFLMTETLGGAKSAPGSLILGILLLYSYYLSQEGMPRKQRWLRI